MDKMTHTISDRLRMIRGDASQANIAACCGVLQQRWSKWESGQEAPNVAALTKIAIHLAVSLDWLVLGQGKEPKATK